MAPGPSAVLRQERPLVDQGSAGGWCQQNTKPWRGREASQRVHGPTVPAAGHTQSLCSSPLPSLLDLVRPPPFLSATHCLHAYFLCTQWGDEQRSKDERAWPRMCERTPAPGAIPVEDAQTSICRTPTKASSAQLCKGRGHQVVDDERRDKPRDEPRDVPRHPDARRR
jgi:hypothetical protein